MIVVASPGKVVKRWSGSKDTLNLVVDRSCASRLIAAQFGKNPHVPIEFPRVLSLYETPAVVALMASLVRDAAQPGSLSRNSVIARQMGDLLVSSFLASFPHSRSKELADEGRWLPVYLQDALKRIEADLQADLEAETLATSLGVSPRTLYAGFKRHLGTSPARYLLAKRLEAARTVFLVERPNVGTIGATARSLGFASTSHFSREYLARFGENPTKTLRSI
jgi:transcriptional regulator GlxA family with amidase domain